MGQGIELGVEVGSVGRLRLKEVLDVPCHDREHRASDQSAENGARSSVGSRPPKRWSSRPGSRDRPTSAPCCPPGETWPYCWQRRGCPLRATAATLRAVEVSLP